METMNEKVAMVTGASAGIGLAFPSRSIYYSLCLNTILFLHHSRSLSYSHANNMFRNVYPKIDRQGSLGLFRACMIR